MAFSATEQRRFGLAKEAVRGTAETTPTKWIPVDKDTELEYSLKLLADDALRGIQDEYPAVSGPKEGKGKIKMALDAQTCGEFFYGLLGSVASAEDTIITISNSNRHIDFNIGSSDLDATIANGSYVIGTTSATASTLCAAIKDALFAADATGTYTVTYSRTTKKFTIARSTGTFVIKWTTGSNVANGAATTLGYTADDTGGLSYVSDSEVEYSFTHTFTRSTGIQRQAYTYFLDRGMNVLKYSLGCVKKLELSGPVDNLLMMDVDAIFKTEASGSIGSPAFPTQRYMAFNHSTIKLGGVTQTNVKDWKLSIDNGSEAFRVQNTSQDIADVLVRKKMKIQGNMTVFFETATERDKFIANTTNSLQFLIEGATIGSTFKWTVNINLYKIQYSAFAYGEEDGLLAAKVEFAGVYSSSDSKSIQVAVTNQDTSY